MADAQRTVDIIFNGRDNVGPAMDSVRDKLSGFTQGMQGVTAPVADLTKGVLAAETALAALVAGGFALSINAAGKFGDSFNEIRTIISGTDKDVAQFKQSILEYARTSGSSIADINKAIYNAISAGVDYKDALGGLAVAEKLATAGQAGLNESYDLLTSTLNAYGTTTKDAARYSDVFFKTVELGKTTIPELSASLAQVTGLAASAGMPIETLGAALAALTATGLPTSQAISALKQAISNIIKPSGEAEKMASALGLQFNASALKSKGFEGVMRDVSKVTGGSTAKMAELFGSVEALNAVLILTGKGSGKFSEALTAMRNSAGATETAYGKMAENFGKANQRLVNSLEVTLIEVGDPLLAQYGKTARSLADVFSSISIGLHAGAFDPIFAAVNALGADMEAAFKGIAAALPEALGRVDYSKVLKAFDGLGTQLRALFVAMFDNVDLSTPEGLAHAIQKIVDGAAALTNVTSGVVAGFKPFVEQISRAATGLADMDEGTHKSVGTLMGMVTAVDTVLGVFDKLSTVLDLVVLGIGGKLAGEALPLLMRVFPGAATAATAFSAAMTGTAASLSSFAAAAAAVPAGYMAGQWLYQNVPAARTFGDALGELAYKLTHLNDTSEEDLRIAQAKVRASEAYVVQARAAAAATASLPSTATVDFDSRPLETFSRKLDDAGSRLDELPDKKAVSITAETDTAAVAKAKAQLDTIPTIKGVDIKIGKDGVFEITNTRKAIENIPDTKKVDVEVDSVAIQRIKSQAEVLQSALDIKGKIDVANIEAETERIKSAFESINNTIDSTGSVLSNMFGEYGKLDQFGKNFLESQIKTESQRRDKALAMQAELVAAQTKLIQAREAATRNGQESVIRIEGKDVEPELEAFMWKIIKRVQLRAAAEYKEFLLGLPQSGIAGV